MMKNSKALKRYYRQIRSWLPVSIRQKKQIIRDLRSSIDAFLDAHPQADLQEIQAHFGTPSVIAAAYVDNTDTATLLRDLRVRRRIFAAVIAGVLIFLFVATTVITWEIVEYSAELNGGTTTAVEQEKPPFSEP